MGFADRIEKPVAMAASFNVDRFMNVPKGFGRNEGDSTMTKPTNEKPAEGAPETPAVKTEAEIRAELAARAKEIRSLCKLAGMPELADDFVDSAKSTADIIAALDAEREKRAKAKPGGKPEVSARHNPNAPENQPEIDPVSIYDRWNKSGKRAA
jgi:hypothetical protein